MNRTFYGALVLSALLILMQMGCLDDASNPAGPDPGPTVRYAGKTYHTVKIGSQYWLKENLDVGVMIRGSDTARNNGTIEKHCYNNDTANCHKYGGLYQWNEAMAYSTTPGTQGICPPGWHIPTLEQFQILRDTVTDNGNSLKDTTEGTGSGKGANTSGFSALLAGYRYFYGTFDGLRIGATMWSSTESNATGAHHMTLIEKNSNINFIINSKNNGFSVRCIKD